MDRVIELATKLYEGLPQAYKDSMPRDPSTGIIVVYDLPEFSKIRKMSHEKCLTVLQCCPYSQLFGFPRHYGILKKLSFGQARHELEKLVILRNEHPEDLSKVSEHSLSSEVSRNPKANPSKAVQRQVFKLLNSDESCKEPFEESKHLEPSANGDAVLTPQAMKDSSSGQFESKDQQPHKNMTDSLHGQSEDEIRKQPQHFDKQLELVYTKDEEEEKTPTPVLIDTSKADFDTQNKSISDG